MSPKTTHTPEVDEPSMNGQEPPEPIQDPFDPELHMVSPDDVSGESGGSRSSLFDPAFALDDEDASPAVNPPVNDVPIRKPDKLKFYRVHPKFVLDRYILVVRDGMDETSYLITADLRKLVPEAVTKARIYPYISTTKTVALWRVNHPKEGSRRNRKVYDSAARATEAAKNEWTRVWWNAEVGSYSYQTARVDLGEPQWPDMDFQEMLETAFDGLVIDTADHPVLRAIMLGDEQ